MGFLMPVFPTVCHPIMQLMVNGAKFEWTEGCQEAFTWLNEALCSMPVLAYRDLEAVMLLDMDASNVGVRAVLSQTGDDGKERVLGYASQVLNCPEKNY